MDRNALLKQIQEGKALKKVVTKDRSAPRVGGKVVGEQASGTSRPSAPASRPSAPAPRPSAPGLAPPPPPPSISIQTSSSNHNRSYSSSEATNSNSPGGGGGRPSGLGNIFAGGGIPKLKSRQGGAAVVSQSQPLTQSQSQPPVPPPPASASSIAAVVSNNYGRRVSGATASVETEKSATLPSRMFGQGMLRKTKYSAMESEKNEGGGQPEIERMFKAPPPPPPPPSSSRPESPRGNMAGKRRPPPPPPPSSKTKPKVNSIAGSGATSPGLGPGGPRYTLPPTMQSNASINSGKPRVETTSTSSRENSADVFARQRDQLMRYQLGNSNGNRDDNGIMQHSRENINDDGDETIERIGNMQWKFHNISEFPSVPSRMQMKTGGHVYPSGNSRGASRNLEYII